MKNCWNGLSLGAGFLAATMLLSTGRAQPTPSDPAYDGPRQRFDGPRSEGRGGPMRGDADLPFFRPLSDLEQEEALDFARTHMPNFFEIWQELPPDRRRRLPPRIQFAFRLLLDARKNDDKRLYEVMTRQMQLRDEFMGILRDAPPQRLTPDQRERVGAELRQKTREMVNSWLEQRELRIAQMEKSLEAEKKRLAEEKADPDAMIERQFRRLRQESRQFLFMADRLQNAATQPSENEDPLQTPASPIIPPND